MRESFPLPLDGNKLEATDRYYEAQVSLLVTGVDDWLWTSYCTVDTYQGTEPAKLEYLNELPRAEPASAGSKSLDHPMWCPRDYFLEALERRMMQAMREFRATIDTFNRRLNEYVSQCNTHSVGIC